MSIFRRLSIGALVTGFLCIPFGTARADDDVGGVEAEPSSEAAEPSSAEAEPSSAEAEPSSAEAEPSSEEAAPSAPATAPSADEAASRVEAARAAWLESEAPASLLPLAEALVAAGDGPGAVEALERYLALAPYARDVEEVRARIAALRSAPARLTIVTEPAGATVRLDGMRQPGLTPMTLEVAAGAHRIEVWKRGRASVVARVVLGYASMGEVDLVLPDAEAGPEAGLFGEGESVALPAVAVDDADEADEDRTATAMLGLVGGAAATATLGTVLGFMALHQRSRFDERPTERTADRGERLAVGADFCFGVAGGALVGALVLKFGPRLDDEDEEGVATTVRPALGREGGGVVVEGRF